MYFHYVQVDWAPECAMSITISERSSSREHKVKVTSLTVSDDVSNQAAVYSLQEAAVATSQYGITGRRLLG